MLITCFFVVGKVDMTPPLENDVRWDCSSATQYYIYIHIALRCWYVLLCEWFVGKPVLIDDQLRKIRSRDYLLGWILLRCYEALTKYCKYLWNFIRWKICLFINYLYIIYTFTKSSKYFLKIWESTSLKISKSQKIWYY